MKVFDVDLPDIKDFNKKKISKLKLFVLFFGMPNCSYWNVIRFY
jgi:hypothetical protein